MCGLYDRFCSALIKCLVSLRTGSRLMSQPKLISCPLKNSRVRQRTLPRTFEKHTYYLGESDGLKKYPARALMQVRHQETAARGATRARPAC